MAYANCSFTGFPLRLGWSLGLGLGVVWMVSGKSIVSVTGNLSTMAAMLSRPYIPLLF
jgi:hypothetical protein